MFVSVTQEKPLKRKSSNITQNRTLPSVKAGEELMAIRRQLSLKMDTSKGQCFVKQDF